jgi:hypothetical protein
MYHEEVAMQLRRSVIVLLVLALGTALAAVPAHAADFFNPKPYPAPIPLPIDP